MANRGIEVEGFETATPTAPKPLTKADVAGFSELYEKFCPEIQRYLTRVIGNPDEASDLVQSTFEKILKHFDKLPEDADVRPWIYRIAINTSLDQLRRDQLVQWQPWENYQAFFHPNQVDPETPERAILLKETRSQVVEALNKLPPNYRQALVLQYWQGCSHGEIGAMMGISESAVGSITFRAKKQLKEICEAFEVGEEFTAKKGQNRFA